MKVIQRKKGEKLPANTIYVGRPSRWQNPYKMSSIGTWVHDKTVRPVTAKEIAELKGKNLACWCGDWQPEEPEIDCHAVKLFKMANGGTNG